MGIVLVDSGTKMSGDGAVVGLETDDSWLTSNAR